MSPEVRAAILYNFYVVMMYGNMGFAFLHCFRWSAYRHKQRIAGKLAFVFFAIAFNIVMNLLAVGYGYKVRPQYNSGFWPYWLGQIVVFAAQLALWREMNKPNAPNPQPTAGTSEPAPDGEDANDRIVS